jgi:hypothetical protein
MVNTLLCTPQGCMFVRFLWEKRLLNVYINLVHTQEEIKLQFVETLLPHQFSKRALQLAYGLEHRVKTSCCYSR